jgi:hypothetical protein
VVALASLTDITPKFIKENYLGIELLNPISNEPLSESFYQMHINIAQSIFERECGVTLEETQITAELHDYLIQDYHLFAFLSLYKPPVLEITQVALRYPSNNVDTVFPLEWARLQAPNQLQLVPTQGTLSQVLIGQSGSYLPLIFSGIGYLPQLFRISYKAGFPPGTLPYDILDAICKLATISIFAARSDTIFPPGLTSLSLGIDGLSQSFGILNNGQLPAVFGSRIGYYRTELYGSGPGTGFLYDIRTRYHGIPMQVA